MRESGTTCADHRYERIRAVTIDGERYVAWPHVKGKGCRDVAFHLYYAWDSKRERVIVGHCGHFDNAKPMHRH